MSARDFTDDIGSIDQLARGLADSFAMIATITGEGYPAFQNLCDDLQQEYLFAIYNRVREARAGFEKMMDERDAERAKDGHA